MTPMPMPTRWPQQMAGVLLLLAAAVTAACGASPDRSDGAPWIAHIEAMDAALARGDVSAAVRARHGAYLAALGSRRWEGMADVGDASLRLAELPEVRGAMVPEARRAYLSALLRARQQRSLDGVLHAAEAFAALGDRDAARQALVMASAMKAGYRQAELAERMRALRERLEGRVPAASGGGIVSLSALSAAGD